MAQSERNYFRCRSGNGNRRLAVAAGSGLVTNTPQPGSKELQTAVSQAEQKLGRFRQRELVLSIVAMADWWSCERFNVIKLYCPLRQGNWYFIGALSITRLIVAKTILIKAHT